MSQACGLTSFIFAVCCSVAMVAQVRPPPWLPAKSAFSCDGLRPDRPMRPSLRKRSRAMRLDVAQRIALGPQRMHAGFDRRDARGQEGTDRLPGRRAREHPELARASDRHSAARTAGRPESAVGDGALGFWKATDEVFPGTRRQRCWQHKTVRCRIVLVELPWVT